MARGSVVERGNGLSLVIDLGKDGKGKRHQKWIAFHGSKAKAKIKLTELLHAYDNGMLADPRGTLGEYLTRWLSEYVKSNLSPNTVIGYEYVIKTHITQAIGSVPLKNLKPEILQKYYADKLQAGLSSTSVRHHHSLMHRALKHAVQWGLLARNPAESVSPPRYRKTDMRVLSETEVDAVLHNVDFDSHYALFFLAIYTGLRRGELLALRWNDVDFMMAEISVSRSLVPLPAGQHIFKDTKTAKGRRTVAISPNTCQVLRQHLENEMALCGRFGIKLANDRLIFCQWDGAPLKGNSVSKAWRTLVNRLGMPGVRFHDCRHTMATMMLRAGVHPKIVQERLGHSSIAITLDVYSHTVPGLQHAAANKMDELYSGSVSNPLANTLKIDKIEAVI